MRGVLGVWALSGNIGWGCGDNGPSGSLCEMGVWKGGLYPVLSGILGRSHT
jgi:hypothetical protein